jgi:hypothetical protein
MLYNNKKFHFRCYAMMTGDFRAFLYQDCFILTSSLDFHTGTSSSNSGQDDYAAYSASLRRHVTNLSINKKYGGHPGQIPCSLLASYPTILSQLRSLWRDLVQAIAPYLSAQRSKDHFDFYGLDVIADTSGNCFLLELNRSAMISICCNYIIFILIRASICKYPRLPGLESSNNNKEEEDVFYNEMMLDLLRIVLSPLAHEDDNISDSTYSNASTVRHGKWEEVSDSTGSTATAASDVDVEKGSALNLIKWRCFLKKHEKNILAVYN